MTQPAALSRSGLSPALRWALWGAIAALLALPAAAMQFTREVAWGPEDFIAAAMMLGLTGLALEATVRFVTTPLRRALTAGAIFASLLLVWAELAVGIFD
ncbi:MAG: hypothetical protein ACREBO_03590 [Novosphingobium sp.]